jgi:hypothetical protein
LRRVVGVVGWNPEQDVALKPGELRCTLCRRGFEASGKSKNRICGRPRCLEVREVIYAITRAMRDELRADERCQFCAAPPEPDSKYCARHQWKREPCPGCGGRVRRNEGQGNQKRYCAVQCREAAAARERSADASRGAP